MLQEIASARRIQILCGSTVLDGFSFSAGVQRLQTYPPAVHLITQAASRPPFFGRDHIRATTGIYELGHLLDMYHTYKATKQHDKVYALLGICADLSGDLQPNYTLPWHDLFRQTISHILGTGVQIRTWPQREIAMISGKAIVCGLITSVMPEGFHDEVKFTDPTLWGHTSMMSKFSKPIQIGDLICILNGSSQATVIRPCEDFFQIIAAQIPMHDALNTSRMDWPKYLQIQHDLCLVWDWELSTQALGSNVQHQKLGDRLGEELLQPGDEGLCEKSTRMLKIAELLVEFQRTRYQDLEGLPWALENILYRGDTHTRLQTLLDHHTKSLQLGPTDQLNLMWKLLASYPEASLIDKVPKLISQACKLQVPSREGDVWRALQDFILPSSPPKTWNSPKLVENLWLNLKTFIACLEIHNSHLFKFLRSNINTLNPRSFFSKSCGANFPRKEAICLFVLHHRKEELGYTAAFFLFAYSEMFSRERVTAQIRRLLVEPSIDYAKNLVRILDLTEAFKTPAGLVLRFFFMKNGSDPPMVEKQPTALLESLVHRAEVDGLLANRTCITATVDVDQALADLLDTFSLPVVTVTSGMLLIAAEMCDYFSMESLLRTAAVSKCYVGQEILDATTKNKQHGSSIWGMLKLHIYQEKKRTETKVRGKRGSDEYY